MTPFISNNSFTYVLRIIILDLRESAREKARGNTNASRMYNQNGKKREIKSGISGCSSFVFPYFQPATSINRLHLALRAGGRPGTDPSLCSSSSCSSGCSSSSFPLTSVAVTVRGSFVVSRDVIRLAYFQS